MTFTKTPSNSPTSCPSQWRRNAGTIGVPKARVKANTNQTGSHTALPDSHADSTPSPTNRPCHPNHRTLPGSHQHPGTHQHSNTSGNRTLHPHHSGDPTTKDNNPRAKDTSPKAKGGRRASPPPNGNRDNTERRRQRLRHPRCHASNSCSSLLHQTNPYYTSFSSTALEPRHRHSNSWARTSSSRWVGRQTPTARQSYITTTNPSNMETSPHSTETPLTYWSNPWSKTTPTLSSW